MKKIKQATALAAAAALSATMLAGCGGSTEGTASTATETASSASTAAESGNAGEFTYPMATGHSITYWCNLNENIGSYYKDMGETPFGKGLMENTGVDITFLHPPTGGQDEQFNLLVADGDLPDVMEYHWQNYPGGPEKAISDGVIVSLNDIIDQYCPNLKAYLDANPEIARQCRTDDGQHRREDLRLPAFALDTAGVGVVPDLDCLAHGLVVLEPEGVVRFQLQPLAVGVQFH